MADDLERTKPTVWQRFNMGDDADPAGETAAQSRENWYTTNSEYGRFESGTPEGDDSDIRRPEIGDRDNMVRTLDLLDGGGGGSRQASGRPASIGARDTASGDPVTSSRASSRRSTGGVRLPPLKYMPIRDRGDGGESGQDALHQRPEPKRLTTGVAKVYVMNSCSRMWDNLQTVAEGAGLQVSGSSTPGTPADAQVLTVDHAYPEDTGATPYGDDWAHEGATGGQRYEDVMTPPAYFSPGPGTPSQPVLSPGAPQGVAY